MMLKAGTTSIAMLATVLAGCSTTPRLNTGHVPDWVSEDVASVPTNRVDSKTALISAPPIPAPNSVAVPVPVPTLIPAPTVISPPSPAQVSIPQDRETWVPFARWCKANGLPPPAMLSAGPAPMCALNTTNGSFILHVGSRVVIWDRMQLNLGFPPQMINGQMFVHGLDLRKTLRPLVTGPSKITATNRTIVIDPGHGGENAGTRSSVANRYEKEFTLDWARRLAFLLASNKWDVFLTRNSDIDLSLSNRTAVAESRKADVFISLHFNSAAPDDAEAGLETYCLTPSGMPSTVTRGFADDASLAFPNNAFDQENIQLAASIHRMLLEVNGDRDRGVRRARFLGVLRNQRRPAVLIEGGYLSNPREARMISDPAYLQKLAEAVARGLMTAVEVKHDQEPPPITSAQSPAHAVPDTKTQRTEANAAVGP
jgi:N-acetylmuramoyl-L-alanine amidase